MRDRQLRIGGGDGGTNLRGQVGRGAVRAHHPLGREPGVDEGDETIAELRCRQVDGRLYRKGTVLAAQAAVLLHVPADADDLADLLPGFQMAPQRVGVKELAREAFAHHHHARTLCRIGIAQRTPRDDGDAHGFEIGRRGIDELTHVWIVVVALHHAEAVVERALVGQGQRDRRRVHARDAADALQRAGI